MIDCSKTAPDGAIVFANFIDFDQSFGHRRDVAGYAGAFVSGIELRDPYGALLSRGSYGNRGLAATPAAAAGADGCP